jgi:hypothetical protein
MIWWRAAFPPQLEHYPEDFMNKAFHLLATGLLLSCAAVAFGQATGSSSMSSGASMSSDNASTTPKKHHLHLPKLQKGSDTGMSGSGPGVPASANGMGTTPATSSAK